MQVDNLNFIHKSCVVTEERQSLKYHKFENFMGVPIFSKFMGLLAVIYTKQIIILSFSPEPVRKSSRFVSTSVASPGDASIHTSESFPVVSEKRPMTRQQGINTAALRGVWNST